MEKVKEFFNMIITMFKDFNGWLKTTLNFDGKFLGFYNSAIAPLAEWIKITGLVVIVLLAIIGLVVIIKKAYKVILILLIIGIIAGVVLFFLIK
ncbi:MAG: hypothetical protein ACOX02_03660 [Acholeplasmatales bacterium]